MDGKVKIKVDGDVGIDCTHSLLLADGKMASKEQ